MATLKSVRENFRRPSGARLRLPLHPALKAPGYCQSPLRGANPSFLFHCIARRSILTHTLRRCATQEPVALFSQEEVGRDEDGEDDGDYSVHGEEGGVEIGEIAGLDEGMFVEQEHRDHDDAGDGEFAESESWDESDQQEQHDGVEGTCDPESAANAGVARDGMEAGVAVEVVVLAGIEDIEAGDPEGDGCGEKQNARAEGAANGDPSGGGRDAESKTEHEMRPASKALGIGVEEQHGKSKR